MCGVAGLYSKNAENVRQIAVQMADAIAHRGPDGVGVWSVENLALSHRRLSIVDTLDRSNQPMVCSDNRFVLSYNGELYNYKELKIELEELGYHFRTESDTEVLLNSFKHWNTDCLSRLEGMFAFAIWDTKEEVLTLARDHCGIKPLYYYSMNGIFCFSSEIKGILQHPSISADVDTTALAEYFTFQNFFNSRLLYKDIYILEAGSFLKFKPKDFSIKKIRYWDFAFREPDIIRSDDSYREELSYLFEQSVKRHLMSDENVNVGCYLSGGVDSGSIASIAKEHYPELSTFCIGFETQGATDLEAYFDETDAAAFSANHIGTRHFSRKISAGHVEEALKAVTQHIEEPRVGQSYPNYYAAKLASEHVKVVLTGTGGDELFAGYPWRYYRTIESRNFESYTNEYYRFWQRLVPSEAMPKLFCPIEKEIKDFNPKRIFRNVFKGDHHDLKTPADMLNASLYFEAKTFLHGLLVIEDKLNMASGVESRVPFLDRGLVEFAMQLPAHLKLRHLDEVSRINENEPLKSKKFYEKTNDGKLILREVMENHLPKEVRERQKQGFSAPDSTWFQKDSAPFINKLFFEKDSPVYEFFDKKTVRNLITSHIEKKENRRLLIWSLLTFDEWLKENIL